MLKSARLALLPALAALSFGGVACGSDPAGPTPKEGLEFLVGDWEADSLVATNQADPSDQVDLLAAGSDFRINVQPSGQYTATLTVLGATVPEIGTLEVDGSTIILYREFPTPDTSFATLTQLSDNRVRLVGDSSFDFDQDGASEPAELLTELVRQTP